MLVYESNMHRLTEKPLDPEDTLKSLQSAVGGHIERVPIPDLEEAGVDVWVNEDGKLMDLRPSILLAYKGEILDVMFGDVAFTGTDGDGGTGELTEVQKVLVEQMLSRNWIRRRNEEKDIEYVFAEMPILFLD